MIKVLVLSDVGSSSALQSKEEGGPSTCFKLKMLELEGL